MGGQRQPRRRRRRHTFTHTHVFASGGLSWLRQYNCNIINQMGELTVNYYRAGRFVHVRVRHLSNTRKQVKRLLDSFEEKKNIYAQILVLPPPPCFDTSACVQQATQQPHTYFQDAHSRGQQQHSRHLNINIPRRFARCRARLLRHDDGRTVGSHAPCGRVIKSQHLAPALSRLAGWLADWLAHREKREPATRRSRCRRHNIHTHTLV